MIPRNLTEPVKVYAEWQAEICIDLLDQILKSPEMVSEVSTMSEKDKRQMRKDQIKILEKALRLEAEEIIKKNKVKTKKEFDKNIKEIPDDKLRNIRKKMIITVLKERFGNG